MAAECEAWIAEILSAQGQVEVIRAGATRAKLIDPGETKLCPGDTLRAGALSKATLLLANQTRATIDEATEFTLPQTASSNPNCQRAGSSNRPLLEILKGAIRFISRTPTSLEICAPYVNAAIEGTEFVVRAKPTENYVWVSEGRVLASNAQGSLSLKPGEGVVALTGAPLRRITVKPEDATQWSLYYPPVIDYRAEVYSTGPAEPTIAKAIADYREDDLVAAFAQLEDVPEAYRNAEYYSLRAGLLLSAGRVKEALADTEQSLRIDPAQGIAYALQSIVAVTQNKTEQALALAQRAQQLDSESSVPEIALSYAYQAIFDIEKARQSVRRAVELSPEDALAWSRLAELELSLGYLDEALAAAEKAEKLDLDLARTQTVLGFAYLTQIDISEAKTAFRKAIDFDAAAPLPRLGLGLATIRQGDLDEGTKQIETAAILDPDNALIRSYLGKAYYEQKRGGLAATELVISKELDPNDPTPWFYDAIRKQTTNRPVEALHDIQKAIELNDNRAVYRSSLLLDQDEAARSASLGRIYNDLGFQQLGLVEGWTSVNTDPSNYSAHRLLADNYAALPRHEIARVSELLQSQLLQPLNINNLQPQLAERGLQILEGAGPSALSFNEFNPLFTRNRLALQANGIVGNNETFADDVVVSTIQGRFSYSFGQFHYETDGFRDNNDVKHDIYNVFTQIAVTPELNVQAEYRRRETEQGDLELRFDPNIFSRDTRRDVEQDTARIGAHYAMSPQSYILFSGFYSKRDQTTDLTSGVPETRIQDDTKGWQGETQYMFKHDRFNATIGGGADDLDFESRQNLDFFGPCPLPTCEIKLNPDPKHHNAYLYINVPLRQGLTGTVGLSYDSFEQLDLDLGKFNPKLGVQWNITDSVRLRSAYFRTVRRTLAFDQSIEPTQVAGFNQFFDDFNGTVAERYGVGLDAAHSENLYSGVEYSRRDLKVPAIRGVQDPTVLGGLRFDTVRFDRWEDLLRAYLYWTPHRHWALSAEAEFEQFKRSTDPNVTAGRVPRKVETVSLPLTARYFHPGGFFASLDGTFVRQELDVAPTSTLTQDDDEFFLVNGSIGYRLPNRRGIVSLEARNMLDKKIFFQDENFIMNEPENPKVIPDRSVFLRLTLAIN